MKKNYAKPSTNLTPKEIYAENAPSTSNDSKKLDHIEVIVIAENSLAADKELNVMLAPHADAKRMSALEAVNVQI